MNMTRRTRTAPEVMETSSSSMLRRLLLDLVLFSSPPGRDNIALEGVLLPATGMRVLFMEGRIIVYLLRDMSVGCCLLLFFVCHNHEGSLQDQSTRSKT